MMSNVVELRPPAAAAAVVEAEPLEAAVREVSGRIAQNNAERRLLFYRLDELRGLTPLRRKRVRPSPPAMSEPVTFFSIEEVCAEEATAPRQVA